MSINDLRILRNINNISSDLIAYVDHNLNFTYANNNFKEFFSIKDDFNFGNFLGTNNSILINKQIFASFFNKKTLLSEVTFTKNGYDYLTNIKVIPDILDSKIVGINVLIFNTSITHNYDYSDFKSKVKYNKTFFQNLFSQSDNGFFAMFAKSPIDWFGSQNRDELMEFIFSDFEMEYTNDAFLKQSFYSSSFVSYLTPNELYAKNLVFTKGIWKNLFDKGNIKFENEFRRSDGSLIWLSCDYYSIKDNNGNIIGVFGFHKDVTANKYEEYSKLENQMNFETFFNLNQDILFVLDLNGLIIKSNRTANKKLSFDNNELVGLSYDFIFEKNSKAEVIEYFKNFNKSNHEILSTPLISKYGIIINAETRIIQGSWNGKPALFAISKDLSEIIKSEEKLSKIFHNNSAFMLLTDLNNDTVTDINEIFAKKLGLSRNEILNISIENLNIFFDPNQYNNIKNKVLVNRKIKNQEVMINSSKGDIYYCSLSASIINTYNENFLVFVLIDITEKKKTQLLLEESEKRYKIIFDGTSEGILVADSSNGNFLFANKSICQMLGYSLEELLNMNFTEIHPKEHLESLIYEFNNVDRRIPKLISNVPVIKKTGEIFYCDFKDKSVTFDNKRTNLAFITDVTHRWKTEIEKEKLFNDLDISNKNLEETLFERNLLLGDLADKEVHLKRVIAEKDKFFSIIAHDLKAPFNGFLGFTEIMKNELYSMSLNEMMKFSNVLYNSAENLYKLLDNLLNWSKIQSDSMEYFPITININEIINDNIKFVELSANKKEIEIVFSCDKEYNVLADSNMISSIIRNFLTNAIKFSHRKNSVVINSYIENGNLVISVKDFGVGIPNDKVNDIFRIDCKTSSLGTEGELSTGIGLILSKEYITINQGNIWFETIEGQGSTFFISLPVLIED